jgi:MFS family permease
MRWIPDVSAIWSFVRTEGRPRYYLALLLISNVCASASWGILTPTIITNCLNRGSSTLVIGILTSIWALPFLIAAPIYARIVGRVSAKPALLVGMSADVLCVWLFPLLPYDWAWVVLQIISGATLGHFSLITEAWLNLFSSERSRAQVTSLYGILPAIGYALGAGIYALVGYQGYAPYLAASAAMAIGILPILMMPKEAADIVLGGEERLRHAFGRAPLLLTIALLAGVLEMVPWSLMQVYAIDNKWSVRAAAFALPIFYWGQVLLTYPIGWIADRRPIRNVLLGTSAGAVLCMASLALLARSPALWVVVFLSGGIATATYTLGLAILGQRFDARTLVSANAAFIACYGAGTFLGPPAVGALMDRLGPNALPTALGSVSACIFLCASAARLEWQRRETARAEL